MSIDRARLARLLDDERRRFLETHPRSEELFCGAREPARRRAHELDGQVGRRLPALRPRGRRRPLHRRRRPRLHRLLPGRHRRHGRPLSPAAVEAVLERRRDGASPRCCPPRTRSASAPSSARVSACPTGSSRSPRPTPTASPCAWPAQSRRPYVLVFNHCYHGTVDETFAGSGRRNGRRTARATSARRSTRPDHQGRRVQRRRGAGGARSARATWPACSWSRR